MFQNIRDLDKKFALGTILGIVGFGYAFYVDSIREERPEIVFEVISNTNVLDLKVDVGKLDILYGTESIKKKKENLRVLTVKIANEGNENIIESHYDSNNPFGFLVTGGKIIERPELLETSIDYFTKNLKIELDSVGRVTLNKVQFDEGQFFILKVLTICNQDSIPKVIPFGKVSGITKTFPVRVKTQGEQEEKGFWKRLIEGSFWIHFTRFWFYFLVLAVFGVGIGVPISLISDSISKGKRKRRIKKFKENSKIELTLITESIFEIYLRDGESDLRMIQHVLSKPDILKNVMKFEQEEIEKRKLYQELEIDEIDPRQPHISDKIIIRRQLNDIVYSLNKRGVIKQDGENFTIDSDYEKTLAEFLYFLKVQ